MKDMNDIYGFIKVEIPQNFSRWIKELNIENPREFLLKMCEDSKLKPIVDGDDIIGFISYSVVNSLNDGIISYGKLFKKAGQELIANNDKTFEFSCIKTYK